MKENKERDIETAQDLRSYCVAQKPNPLERVMATNLFLWNIPFKPQVKLSLPDGWQINGRKYFIADFLVEPNIIIETDGKIHEEEKVKEKDKERDNALTALGYRIFHFTWDDVMGSGTADNFDIMTYIVILKGILEA